MNYTGRYGLEINPFIKNGKDVLVETNEYKEVKFRLNYLLQTKGFWRIDRRCRPRQDNKRKTMGKRIESCRL